jgi:uncharacterized protein YceH (UPF0502 family)
MEHWVSSQIYELERRIKNLEWEIGEIRSKLDRIAENPTIQDILQRLEDLESRIYDLADRIDSLEATSRE